MAWSQLVTLPEDTTQLLFAQRDLSVAEQGAETLGRSRGLDPL